MGQVISCFRDQCQKLKRQKLLSNSNSSEVLNSSISQSSNINDSAGHRVILIEEQDDPDEVLCNKEPSGKPSIGCEIVSQAIPDSSSQVRPTATFNTSPSTSVPSPDHVGEDRTSERCTKVRPRSPSPIKPHSVKKSKLEDHLNFPIFEDPPTKDYVSKSNVLVIMRGLSGSGKSHLTKKLIESFGDNAVECSADLYFVQPDGRYEFDPTLLKDAHNFCFESAKHEVSVVCRPLVIINNTNIKFWEYKRYLHLAAGHNYTTLIMEPKTPWAWNPQLLAQRNVHDVSEELISKKLALYERSEPIYFAWFLNPSDSCELLRRGFACLREVVSDEGFRSALARSCLATAPHFLQGGGGDPRTYYSQCGRDGAFKSLHCTAMFSGKGKRPGAQEYSRRPAVLQSMGKVFTLRVTELVITPRTVGARVVLSPEQLELWGQDDESDVPETFASLYASVSEGSQGAGPDVKLMESMLLQQASSDPKLYDCDRGATTFRTCRQDCIPDRGGLEEGNRAHITLAVGPGVSPVVTGFDLLQLLRQRGHCVSVAGQTGCGELRTAELNTGRVTQYDGGVFGVHLDEGFEIAALFSAYY